MTKSIKTLALFMALAIGQTAVIPAVYAEDSHSGKYKIEQQKKENERREREWKAAKKAREAAREAAKKAREAAREAAKKAREAAKEARKKGIKPAPTPVATPVPVPTPAPAPVVVNPTPTPVPVPAPAPTTGKAVYDAKCASCHVLTGTTTKNLAGKGAKVATSHKAGILTATEVSLLAAYLNSQVVPAPAPVVVTPTPAPAPAPVVVTPTPAPAPAPVVVTPTPVPAPTLDGAALYTAKCASCHGTSKRGKSVTATQSAITNNVGGMGFLSTLTAAQLTAIAQY